MRSLALVACLTVLAGCPGEVDDTDGGTSGGDDGGTSETDGGGQGQDGGGSTPPGSIHDVYPRDGATGLWRYTDLLVEFAQPMQESTVKVVFEPPPAQAFSKIWDGQTLNLTPGLATTLSADTQYRATVTGKTVSGGDVAYAWSFRTRPANSDSVPPTVTSVPADGVTGVAPEAHVVFQFSEPVVPAYSDLQASRGPLGELTWNDGQDRLDVAPPPGGWVPGSTPSLLLRTEDVARNGLDHTLVFSVAEPVAPLAVLGLSPPPGATNVPTVANISISFSRDMNPTSTASAVTVTPSSGCEASSAWINPRLYQCVPWPPLVSGTAYTVTVGTGATDALGNALGAPYSASFTAATVSDSVFPSIASSLPVHEQRGVVDGTPLVVGFSEPMDRASVEAGFTVSGNGLEGRFGWNADSTELTFTPTQHLIAGTATEWSISGASDLAGRATTLGTRRFWSVGVGDWAELPVSGRAVTAGSSGSRTMDVTLMMVGDDSRDQQRAAFLSFEVDDLSGGFTTVTDVRSANLRLPRFKCEGGPSALNALRIETVEPGDVIDAADLATSPTGPVVTVESPCSASQDLFVNVTPLVQTAFEARASNGGTLHLRVRFTTPTNGDHQPDRLVFTSPRGIGGPELRVVYQYGTAP